MRLRLVVVGKDRGEPLLEAADAYLDRMRHHLPVELVEVKEVPLKKNSSVEQVKAEEAQRLEKILAPDEYVVVLDERGQLLTSPEVAGRLDRWMQDGLRSVALVIGGPSGLDPSFMKRARERWALSKMTLPHRMARLVLSEQLYRGLTILRGEPYHK
ncbi:MAG: 23S rRNA (pseudouridine(1915)-N(3))-methyltransferase RlmH [Deltaproteobacteria bacterium]|nr:23S rRNA (pseudouridine(1915)-N(3))-methyltransferase RlmH [Deltaproteobacteria bacterium]